MPLLQRFWNSMTGALARLPLPLRAIVAVLWLGVLALLVSVALMLFGLDLGAHPLLGLALDPLGKLAVGLPL